MPQQHNTNNKFLVCGYTKKLNTTTDPYSTDRSYYIITDAHVTVSAPGSVMISTSQSASQSVIVVYLWMNLLPFIAWLYLCWYRQGAQMKLVETHEQNTQAYIIHFHNFLFIKQYTCA